MGRAKTIQDELSYYSIEKVNKMIEQLTKGVPIEKVIKMYHLNLGIGLTKQELLTELHKYIKKKRH